jgi:hypothetical protein
MPFEYRIPDRCQAAIIDVSIRTTLFYDSSVHRFETRDVAILRRIGDDAVNGNQVTFP